jgi:cellulose synthase/poly-beta-1,6-N-acetylglucosamine synthase-like glycosyltransferase
MIIRDLEMLSPVIVDVYVASLILLMIYGLHRYWIVYQYWRYHVRGPDLRPAALAVVDYPLVAIQLPLYNERFVAERLLDTVAAMDYPADKLEIQVLDDSTDDTVELVARKSEELQKRGIRIRHIRRPHRQGYKAGALAYGLERTEAEFVAIFDADFLPPKDFLKATLPYFQNEKVGMVQARWGHLNANYSLLTRLQALFLDGHFMLEHLARFKSGAFFNFNGTAGIWRRDAIESAGGWSPRTLTEDLDLSYRAQLRGWKFIYLPDLICPAELPADIHGFRTQQHRWTKGAIQVMRHMLKEIWTSSVSLKIKVESTFHLTANVGYLLTIVVAILLLPTLFFRHSIGWGALSVLEVSSFLITTMSVLVFYGTCQRELYSDWKWRMRDIPALMSFGIGMGLNNAVAVWDGLFGGDTEFVRTPKFNLSSHPAPKRKKNWSWKRTSFWVAPAVFALYSATTLVVAAYLEEWITLPFIGLFVFGFFYVAGLALSRPPSQA